MWNIQSGWLLQRREGVFIAFFILVIFSDLEERKVRVLLILDHHKKEKRIESLSLQEFMRAIEAVSDICHYMNYVSTLGPLQFWYLEV